MAQQHPIELRDKTRQRKENQDTRSVAAQPLQTEFHRIPQLQKTLGNRQVAKLIQTKRLTPEGKIIGLQRKLTVGAADDQYEQEADQVARQVMAMPDAEVTAAASQNPALSGETNQTLQTKPLAVSIMPVAQQQAEKEHEVEEDQDGKEEKDLLLQARASGESVASSLQRDIFSEEEDKEPIQFKTDQSLSGSFDAGNDIETQLSLSKGRGSPLPDPVRNFMEPRFGVDFGHVRIHTGGDAVQMNRNVGAQAFTHGTDIYYGDGHSLTNLELTAHELTHVIQQAGSPPLKRKKRKNEVAEAIPESSIQRICKTCDTDGKKEKEADSLADSSIVIASGLLSDTESINQKPIIQRRIATGGATSSGTAPNAPAGRGKSRSSSAPANPSSSETSAQHSQSADTPASANATGEAATARAPAGSAPGSASSSKKSSQSSLRPVASEAPETATDAGTATQNSSLLIMPEPPSDISARDRTHLEQVRENAGEATAATTDLPSAESSVADARSAVEEPAAETQARAEDALVTELDQRQPPSPEIEELCQRIREVIRSKRPPDEDSLVEADPEEMASQAGGQLNGTIESDTNRVQSSYNELQSPPQGQPAQQPQAIESPPASVEAPPVDAQAAVPEPVPAESISLDADVEANQQRMDDAGMNSESAQLVRSGPIAEARTAQGELQGMAERDPAEVLAEQVAARDRASIGMAALERRALQALATARATSVTQTDTGQRNMVGTEEQMRARIGADAQRIFQTAQTQVNNLLDPLSRTAMSQWDTGVAVLSERFKQRLHRVKAWLDERYSGAGGAIVEVVERGVIGLPGWVTEEYDAAERDFGDGVCDLIRDISSHVNGVIATCEGLIEDARSEISDLFTNLPAELQEWAVGEQARFTQQLDGLHDHATQTRDNFTHDLAQRASQSVQEVRQQIHTLREAAGGIVGRIASAVDQFLEDPAKFIIEGLLELVGIPPASFWALVNRIQQVIADIADNPLGFANNLVAALGQGFQKFFDNFSQHILGGFFEWLFSGLGAVGVQIPTDFSLNSLITFFLQLMGITWARIRGVLARHIGEENVALLEKAYELIAALMERGVDGIFELIKEQLNPQAILDAILRAAVDFMIDALIRAVTPRIIGLFNPAGAIVQAIEVIYRVLAWVFENAARIFTLVETVVNGAADLIAGNIGGMATAVEGALARILAPVIDFLAGFLGMGDLPDRIADTIRGFQEMVLGVIDRVVAWLAERARGLLRTLGIGEADESSVQPRTDLPADPAERLQVALREIRPRLNQLLDTGIPEDGLRRQLADWRVEFNLRELDLIEGRVVAGNSPTVDVATVVRANASELRRMLAQTADEMMTDPRVLREQERILRAHRGSAGIAREQDSIIPAVPVGAGPSFLGAAGALREADRPARFGPRSPVEFASMPFSPGLSGEQQSAPGPGGVIVGRGEEPGVGRVSVTYPALIARYRQIANAQRPPLSDRHMAGIVTRYVRSGVMAPPFDQGTNAIFLAEFARIVFSVEIARSQTFAVESALILSLLQTGRLTFEQAFGRESPVNPMTMAGASAATRTEEAAVRGTIPAGRPATQEQVATVMLRRSELIVSYALQEIERRKLTFGSVDDVMTWARTYMIDLIREHAENLFGLSDQPPGSTLN